MIKRIANLVSKHKGLSLFACVVLVDAGVVLWGLAAREPYIVNLAYKPNSGQSPLTGFGSFHVVLWTIGPPIWFFFETYAFKAELLPGSTDPDQKPAYDRFRLGQELASKVWAAVLTAILFLVTKI